MYIMKQDIIIVSVLFVLIILVAMWFSSTPSYIPYSSTIFSNQARFEGFSTRNGVEYSSVKDNSALDGPVTNYLLAKQDAKAAKAVPGFEGVGVFLPPDQASAEKLDIYSQATGSLTAEGYGYYNSQGPLVMDANMKKMLQTRGGNTTGVSSSIGGSTV